MTGAPRACSNSGMHDQGRPGCPPKTANRGSAPQALVGLIALCDQYPQR